MSTRRVLANAIRALSIDSIEKAGSGHPGAPMGMADIAEVLWNDYLKHNPSNPNFINRDRFVLSNGHASILLYALLHLTGYDLTINDLKKFRQLDSRTPGHPEVGHTPGVETTTGPLGQGLANAVGMALAEKMLGEQFNRPGYNIIDHQTYAFIGDGCLMEGISHEVSSLAGTLSLAKLTVFYDDNRISIDGGVEGWFTDDTPKRFESYNWNVIRNVDGHNGVEIKSAIEHALKSDRPTLICCKTTIGFGSPNKQGTSKSHGSPLGQEESTLTRKVLEWNYNPFEIPKEIYKQWNAKEKGAYLQEKWDSCFESYSIKFPKLSSDLSRRLRGDLTADFDIKTENYIEELIANPSKISTRKASHQILNNFAPLAPEIIGGSADLSGSNLTLWEKAKPISAKNASGNYLHYGVREFGMSSIMNGIALHGGFIPFGGTFLIFMEYARNAIRMSALMKLHTIYVFTHDSIGLGEDGPTHQPIEQLNNLRTTPGLETWRPAESIEAAIAWKSAIKRQCGPSSLVFSRQNLEKQVLTEEQALNIYRGGYILKDSQTIPELIIIATGSEVEIAVAAYEKLTIAGYNIRVVSMPCTNVYDSQDMSYKESVLPVKVTKRISIEASHPDFWYKYVGLQGIAIGINSFGASAPAPDLFKRFGLTSENVFSKAKRLILGAL